MHSDYFIVIDKDKVDMSLLRTADSSLPRIMRYMNTAVPFVGLKGAVPICACLVEHKEGYSDIVNFAVLSEYQGQGYGRAMLDYVKDYILSQGVRYLDIGCGNADIRLIVMLQKAGFRMIGVWPNYYTDDGAAADVINSIINRDMIRLRVDLMEKRLATIGYDASGRT
ncbi:MAG: GNAT family N-acetyltransferase [Oscillospiraceae bacterium]|nr:GNAT family N-acetyltransferase [Oscillospiraceae bacterium]